LGLVALLLRQFVGMAGHEQVGAVLGAHVEAGHLAAQQAVDPVHPREFEQCGGRLVLAFGQGQHLAGLERQVPAAVADPFGLGHLRLERGCGVEQAVEIGHARRRAIARQHEHALGAGRSDRLQLVTGLVDQHQLVALAQHAVGVRSTTSTTSVSGNCRETRASLTQGSVSSVSRKAATSTRDIAWSRWPSTFS
jgi:hypothetical protein